jgi:hypothetical protein
VRRAELEEITNRIILEKRAELAAEFDAIHSVERAHEVGSLEAILEPETLRASLIGFLASW